MEVLSIVVPCYNEKSMISIFYEEVVKVMNKIKESLSFEIIFVDDGSSDETLEELKKLSQKDLRIKFISFSRNFGKESAIYAGLEKVSGDIVSIMDVDLQDPPELLYSMYEKMKKGNFDCVSTRRITREGEPVIRSWFSKKFYTLINKLSNIHIADGARDYCLMTRKVSDSFLKLKEYNRFSKGIFRWLGFKTTWIGYENIKRFSGETKWSFWKLFVYSIDAIVAFSTVPLAISSIIGMVLCLISFVMICVIIFKTIVFGETVSGYPSLMCTIILIGGIQLFCTGILGQYLSKVYMESKKRPLYIVKEEN